MSISTLNTPYNTANRRNSKMKPQTILIYVVAVIGVFLLVFFGKSAIMALKKMKGKSSVSVDVTHGRAEIMVNGEQKGVTPYESDDIKPGENKITLKSSTRQYETTIDFLSNNDKYIHRVGIYRDLGVSELFSAGQDLWFDEDESGTVLRVISEPIGASVFIDNSEIGKTPFTSSKLSEGDYDIRVEQVNYEPQKARVRVQKSYTSNVSMKLYPLPVPSRVSPFEGSDNLYDLSTDNNQISADAKTWVKSVVYWNQTRGINLEGVGLNKDLVFNYFLDYQGNIYDELGNLVLVENYDDLSGAERGAYLGRISDGEGLTQAAKDSLKVFKGIQIDEPKITAKILPTGLGWLRVRSEPSINGAEVTKVDEGREFGVLEQKPEWVKIIVDESTQGWVSDTYVEIIDSSKEIAETTIDTTPTTNTSTEDTSAN